MPYYNDDGTEIDELSIEKLALCMTCKYDDDSSQEIECQLNRADQQGDDGFKCYGYVKKALFQ